MNNLEIYMQKSLGVSIMPEPIPRQMLGSLPIYLLETYRLYNAILFEQPFVLVQRKDETELSIHLLEKHFRLLKDVFHKRVVLLSESLASFNRKRLIEKGINFIVPGKQLYLPDFLIDLQERFENPKVRTDNETLLPSAQFLLIYHIIHRNQTWQLENFPFKDIAAKTGYTPMAITKAVENLKDNELIEVKGEKEKFIRFKLERHGLWADALHRNLLINPVLKQVYVDEMPQHNFMLQCNASALPEYTDMNPSRMPYYAVEKTTFYSLQKRGQLKNLNEYEGNYCMEVWKYDPEKLVGELPNDAPVVDPLSLYLSLKDSHDERIEMALEQIIEKFIW